MSTIDTGTNLSVEEASNELYSVVTEVTVVHLAFTMITVFILLFGMFSALIKERFYVGEAIIATAFGIIFGPHCANLIDPRSWGNPSFDDITLEFTRIVLALSVFAVGVELPRAYVKRHWRSLAMVIGPLMIIGWLIVGGLIYALIPGVSFLGALVIGACLTPTDPILAASVVGKGKFAQKHVPSHIRHLLQCESGCNDGAAFPFLYLAMFINFREHRSVGHAVGMWIVLVILYQIVLGVIIGSIVGIAARKVLKFSKRRSLIDRESMVAMYVSLAIFTTAATTLCGSDDLLAAFACGAAFAWDDWFSESIEDSNFSNIIDLLVNCATFIYIGATMPFNDWNNPELTLTPWRLAVLAILILTIRRLPAMVALYKWIPDIKTFREAIFAGFFGPMGVGAIFIATLAITKLPSPTYPPVTADDYLVLNIQPIIYFIVLSSVIVHGTSIPFFNLGKRVHSISRTWTQTSNTEPSWLSRVKRVGDNGGAEVDRDSPDPDADSEENQGREKKRRNGDLDLEAGDARIDDPGMDIGEMTERDYADNEKNSNGGILMNRRGEFDEKRTGRDPEKSNSPAADSDETVAGEEDNDKGKKKEETRSDGEEEHENEGKTSRQKEKDVRRERHDDEQGEEEVWDEGDDEIVETRGGESIEVRHRDHHHNAAEHDKEGEDGEHSQGPGFPGFRMAEIAKMIERGHDLAHLSHDKSSPERMSAKADGTLAQHELSDEEKTLGVAADRIAKKDNRESRSAERSRSTSAASDRKDKDKSTEDKRGRESSRQGKPANRQQDTSASPAPAPHPGMIARMTSLGGGVWPQRPGQPVRRQTLTQEEKYARDAWCRKERRDVDDDEVKAWVSGKHLVIERNNGEDVEVVDANPSQSAREQARKDPALNLREVDISEVNQEKGKVAKERSGERESSSVTTSGPGATRSAPPKRFDMRNMPGRESFRKIFGGNEASTSTNEAAPRSRWVASPVQEEVEEVDSDDQPSRLRFAEGTRNDSADAEGGSQPAAKKTGIALGRSETTDSQIRFGDLPKPRRRR